MSWRLKATWIVPMILGVIIGAFIAVNLGFQTVAQEGAKSEVTDALPLGRTAGPRRGPPTKRTHRSTGTATSISAFTDGTPGSTAAVR